MNLLSWIGLTLFIIACLLDIFIYDQVSEKCKPAVYLLGIAFFVGGMLI